MTSGLPCRAESKEVYGIMPKKGENIRKRKDGRWEARYVAGRQPDGGARMASVYGRTYREAKAKKEAALRAARKEPPAAQDRGQATYSQVLDGFLNSHRYQVKESTYTHYVDVIESHIRPSLGRVRMAQLGPAQIERFTAQKLERGRKDGKGGLSPKTVRDMLCIVRLSLQYAADQQYLPGGAPRLSFPRQPKREVAILTREEQAKLEAATRNGEEASRFGVYLCLYTGLRLGEICGLKWEDVDLTNRTLAVRRTLQRVTDTSPQAEGKTKLLLDEPKTEASQRLVPLTSSLAEALWGYRRKAAGEGSYFLTGEEHFLDPHTYYERYRALQRQCGIGPYGFHILRHTFATRCMERGFDPKALSEILGHANVKITLERYVHPSMEAKLGQMERLL